MTADTDRIFEVLDEVRKEQAGMKAIVENTEKTVCRLDQSLRGNGQEGLLSRVAVQGEASHRCRQARVAFEDDVQEHMDRDDLHGTFTAPQLLAGAALLVTALAGFIAIASHLI